MAYIPVYQSLLGHKFMIRLQIATGLPVVHLTGHLVCLWLWSIDNARDGVLPDEAAIVAHAAQWSGDADTWLAALLNSGFVAMESDGRLLIHDWDDYIGSYFDSLERHRKINRDRQARFRENHRPEVRNVTDNVSVTLRNVTDDVTVTPVTLRNALNLTKINLTDPNEDLPTAAAESPPEPVAAAESPPDGGALPRASPKPTTLNRQQLGRFERWYLGRDVAGYDGYPNKQQRPEAERAWRKLNPDDTLTAQLIADVQERRTGRKWAEGFVDYPAKYLNQRIWEDDIEPCKQGTHHESTGRSHRGTGRQDGRNHRRGAVGAPGSLGPGGYDSWRDES